MKIIIDVPKWIDKKVKDNLFLHIQSLCKLLSNNEITVYIDKVE